MAQPSGRSEPLSQERIVEAALAVTRRDGLDRLTMRAVAAELGVSPMAIYYHVQDKDTLVDLVVAEVRGRTGPLALDDDGWEASLRRHLLDVWRAQAPYPGLSRYMIDQPQIGVTAETMSRSVRFFEEAGFPTATAHLAWSFALTYIHGRLSVDARLRGVPTDERVEGIRAQDYVSFGVDAVVAGLQAMLAAALTEGTSPGGTTIDDSTDSIPDEVAGAAPVADTVPEGHGSARP